MAKIPLIGEGRKYYFYDLEENKVYYGVADYHLDGKTGVKLSINLLATISIFGYILVKPFNEIRLLKDFSIVNKVLMIAGVAFNHKNIYSEINIAEQKIIQGDHHIIKGNNANLNTGTQIGNTLHSNNYEEHSTTTLGDIKDSTIQNATIGNQNCQKNYSDFYDWNVLEANLKAVIVTLNNEVGDKQICNEALKAVKEKNREKFEKIIKNNRAFFTSPLFLNTASGVLAQMFSAILGI
ncbi:hypothetical protein [Enterococcus faecium]|uniref:hypothetical protein n=1 Tax=Enterococcus faecium TaxID=1352 RepID=UPI00215770D1|nr:hypothetical protein [Enterococcus faecium]